MNPDAEMTEEPNHVNHERGIVRALQDFASYIPQTTEVPSDDPVLRARQIATHASLKAGAVSGGLALPPGPMGLVTILPDLITIWKIQQQMVADIAGCFGKTAQLSPQVMIYCLFRHGAAMVVRDLVVRAGERFLVRRVSLRVIQDALAKVGVKVTQRLIGKTISRWLPVLGPIAVGSYAFYDTRQVGKTAIETFRGDVVSDDDQPSSGAVTPQGGPGDPPGSAIDAGSGAH